MYTAFYGLREKPFALTPNPRFLYLADAHREALAHLLYGLEQGEGFIVISGEVGTGKTTLCRSLLERLGGETEVAILFNPSRNPAELLQSINEEFGLPVEGRSRRQLLGALNRFLLDKHGEGHRVVLIIDEAQNLSPGTLEQVRLLSNLETASSKLIQIILLGQPELDEKLDSDALRQLRQRVTVRWRLEPLPLPDSIGYVRHRLQVAAGAERDIFSSAALREIHRHTGGVPRLLNVLCDRALLAGYAAGEHRVGPKLVRTAAREVPDASRTHTHRGLLYAVAAVGLVAALGLGVMQGERARDRRGGDEGEKASVMPAVSSRPDSARMLAEASSSGRETASAVLASPVASAPPLRDDEAWLGVPGEGGARPLVTGDADPLAGSGQGLFLAALLAGQDAGRAVELSVNAVLDSWGEPPLADPPASLQDALRELDARGIAVTALPDADLETVRRLGYPALLPLQAGSEQTRIVALVSLDRGIAGLTGVRASGVLRVPEIAVEEQWGEGAFVLWRSYLEVPEFIVEDDRGAGVLWVQEALVRLGFMKEGISGRYGPNTVKGVEAFQRGHQLEPDGVVGPLTLMLLFAELDEYAPPRLTARGPE